MSKNSRAKVERVLSANDILEMQDIDISFGGVAALRHAIPRISITVSATTSSATLRVFEGFDHHFMKSRRAVAEAASSGS